jgi:multidrug transporter EmrE-like cation transporter
MALLMLNPLALALISAVAYAGATLTMKFAAGSVTPLLAILIVALLLTAVAAEIGALRLASLGVIYLTILGSETLLVLLCAMVLGETLGAREMAGAALVLAGTALLAA